MGSQSFAILLPSRQPGRRAVTHTDDHDHDNGGRNHAPPVAADPDRGADQ